MVNLPSSNMSVDDENFSFEKKIVPANKIPLKYRMLAEENERIEKVKDGGKPKDIEWGMFIENKLQLKDDTLAEKHLKNYINLCEKDGDNLEDLCYELFLDFSQGRNIQGNGEKIKSNVFAEDMITFISNTRDADKLISITTFFEKNRDFTKAEGFYFTLYELFYSGEGVDKDLNKAAKYLKSTIKIGNTPDRRSSLREIYKEQNSSLPEEDRTKKAYEKVIADEIQFAKTDYAVYLRAHDERIEAVRWFVADGEFSEAYKTVNIKLKKEIDAAVDEFKKGAADTEFARSLNLMKSKFDVLQDIFSFKEEPLSYWKLALLYNTIIGPIYALYHTVKLNTAYFAGALIGTIGLSIITYVFSENLEIGLITFVACLYTWTVILLIFDIQRRRRFLAARELWPKLQPDPENLHPKLKECADLFSHKVLIKSSFSWTLIIPFFMLILVPAFVVFAALNAQNESGSSNKDVTSHQEIISEETESKELELKPLEVEQSEKADQKDEKSRKKETNSPSSSSGDATQSQPNTAKQQNQTNSSTPNANQQQNQNNQKSSSESSSNKPLNNTSTNNQKEAIYALTTFHDNITRKDYRQAYSCLSKSLQGRMSYDSWAGGFKTTVSSSASDIKITSETSDKITMTYNLQAVDNPGGTRNFNSTVVVIKTENGWKIDSMSNKLKK